jgi:hypothetical protein
VENNDNTHSTQQVTFGVATVLTVPPSTKPENVFPVSLFLIPASGKTVSPFFKIFNNSNNMKRLIFKTNEVSANNSGAMVVDTIKNGRSSKSVRAGRFFSYLVIASIAIAFISCEKDKGDTDGNAKVSIEMISVEGGTFVMGYTDDHGT